MNFTDLEKTLAREPAYRLKQAKKAIFHQLAESWADTTVFSREWREKLNAAFPLTLPALIQEAADGQTRKALLTLPDGLHVETVLMRHRKRNTVCVSSQVGCPLGCSFCATGKMGFKRNLTDWEILAQVLLFARTLKKEKEKVTNLVFMGMGEPFLNFDAVMAAINLLHEPAGLNLGARRFSLSTAGLPEGIARLADQKLEINLALSLHAPTNTLRDQLMPINKKYPLEIVMAAIDEYLRRTRRKVMFEYLMLKKINDGPQQARELIKLIRGRLITVNLIPYNPTGVFEPSLPGRIRQFRTLLEQAGITVTQRYEFGQEIKAACGQLATENQAGI